MFVFALCFLYRGKTYIVLLDEIVIIVFHQLFIEILLERSIMDSTYWEVNWSHLLEVLLIFEEVYIMANIGGDAENVVKARYSS